MKVNRIIKYICVLLLISFNKGGCESENFGLTHDSGRFEESDGNELDREFYEYRTSLVDESKEIRVNEDEFTLSSDSPLRTTEGGDFETTDDDSEDDEEDYILSTHLPRTPEIESKIAQLNKNLDKKLKTIVEEKLSHFDARLRGDKSTKTFTSLLIVEIVKHLQKYTHDPAKLIRKVEDLTNAKLSEKDKAKITDTLHKLTSRKINKLKRLDTDNLDSANFDAKKGIFPEDEDLVINYQEKEKESTTCAELLVPILLPLLEPLIIHTIKRVTSKSFYLDIKYFFENLFKIKRDKNWTFWSGLKRIFVGAPKEKYSSEVEGVSGDIFKDLLIKLNKSDDEDEAEETGKKEDKEEKEQKKEDKKEEGTPEKGRPKTGETPEEKKKPLVKKEEPDHKKDPVKKVEEKEKESEVVKEVPDEIKELLKKNVEDLTQEEIDKIEEVEAFDFKLLADLDLGEVNVEEFLKQLFPQEKKLSAEEEKIKGEIKSALNEKKKNELKRKLLKLNQLYVFKQKNPGDNRKLYHLIKKTTPIDESKFLTPGKFFILLLAGTVLFL